MQQDNINKIESLVSASSILNDSERSEWLQLLELMNDKQLAELERILRGAEDYKKFKQARPEMPPPVFQPKNISQQSKTVPAAAPKPVAPLAKTAFSHILNLPKLNEGKAGAPTSAISKFATQLKEILAEKELPVPQKSVLPESPPPIKAAAPPANAQTVKLPLKPFPTAGLSFRPSENFKNPPFKISERQPAPKVPVPPKPAPAPVAVKEMPKPELPPQPAIPTLPSKIPSPVRESKLSQPLTSAASAYTYKDLKNIDYAHNKEAGSAIAAGINFTKPTVDYKATIKPQAGELERKPAFAGPLPALNSLEDIARLDSGALKAETSGLAKLLLKLTKSHSLHEVLFKLEKSPVYKQYLNTGIKILNNQASFGTKSPGEYLTKEQFEAFTDLLRQVQAG